MLIEAIRRARAKVVLAAADERIGLPKAQIDQQAKFIAATGRPAGYVNLATERDWVVRFKAQPPAGSRLSQELCAAAGRELRRHGPTKHVRRIAWLREPRDGSDTFLTIPAEILLQARRRRRRAERPRRAQGQDRDHRRAVPRHRSAPDAALRRAPTRLQPGAVIHAHIAAELVDGRSIGQLETNSLALKLALAGRGRAGIPDRLALSPDKPRAAAGQPRHGCHNCGGHICVLAVAYHPADRARPAWLGSWASLQVITSADGSVHATLRSIQVVRQMTQQISSFPRSGVDRASRCGAAQGSRAAQGSDLRAGIRRPPPSRSARPTR